LSFFDSSRHPHRLGRNRLGWVLILVSIVIATVIALMPAPYVINQPGPAYDTLGTVTVDGETIPMISIPDAETFPTDGQLDLLTVRQSGSPDNLPSWSEVLVGWLSDSRAVIPVGEAYPEGTTTTEMEEAGRIQMQNSQQAAIAAALTELDYDITSTFSVALITPDSPALGVLEEGDQLATINGEPITSVEFLREQLDENGTEVAAEVGIVRDGEELVVSIVPYETETGAVVLGIEVASEYEFPITVQIQLENVGGPSAGMMFSLGIIDKLTEGPLTAGENWAGTGTIAEDGTVGPIGGIRQKLYGAERAGADWFLAPADNCDEVVGHIPSGLTVFAVQTLDDSLTAITRISEGVSTDSLPTCDTE
jgi:PDZ domain-containing protein